MLNFAKLVRLVLVSGSILFSAVCAIAQGMPKLLIVLADPPSSAPVTQMTASGKFSTVDTFDVRSATPTLAQLLAYDVILAYTDYIPANPSGLGDVLADAVDAGRLVTVATYGLSLPWAITGRIQTAAYSPLVIGTTGAVSGSLIAVVPTDPIFTGIALGSVTYSHNGNFAHATLASGATLLATDGAGINMIARSSSGRVIGLNLWPTTMDGANNSEFFKLLANIVANNFTPAAPASIPTLSEWGMIILSGLMVLGTFVVLRRRQM